MEDDDDIYDNLLKQGFLKREKDIEKEKHLKKELREKKKILNKVLYRNYKLDDDDKFTTGTEEFKLEKNKKIEDFCDNDNKDYLKYLKATFSLELKNYKYVKPENISTIKPGGYIRCIDINEELKWGGTVIKLINENNSSRLKIQLKNKSNKFWYIKFCKYYVFYKENVTFNDTFRDIFIKKANLFNQS